jgi:magnesium-transporting ATPase (P-type)
VRSSDYSISQFSFLLRLLLIHGRFGYIRVSKMICIYFYKNIVLVFTELLFVFFSGYSGQLFFLDWLPTLYNAVFTSWSCLFAFMYERDVNQAYALKYPIVYKTG